MGLNSNKTALGIFKNAKGISIVEVLIASGIMVIVMAGFTSMLMNQNKETKALSEVLASLDLQKTLVGSLADGTVCGYVLNNPTAIPFDSTALPYTIVLPASRPLYAGVSGGVPTVPIAQVNAAASAFAKSLVVKEIKLTITSGSGNKFFGLWQIDFDPAMSVRPHKPAIIGTVLTANITTPAAATVSGCMGDLTAGAAVAQACAVNELMRGYDSSGIIICEPVDAKFLKLDGTNAMTGNLNMNNRNIVGGGTVALAQGELTTTAVMGTACTSASGTFTKTSTGGLVSCQSGIWKTAQAAVGKQIVANTIASFGNSATVGGQYTINGSGLITQSGFGGGPRCTLSNSTGKCTVGTCPSGIYSSGTCTNFIPTVDGLVREIITTGGCSMAGCARSTDTNLFGWTN